MWAEQLWHRAGCPVLDAIECAAEIPRAAAEDVREILEDHHSDFEPALMGEETEFELDFYYEEKGPDSSAWQEK